MDHESLIYLTDKLKNKKMRFRKAIILLLFVSFLSIYSQDTTSLNLKQCIDLALKNNIDLLRNESQMEISQERLHQSRAANTPYVNAYLSQGQNSGKSINPYTNTFLNRQIITGQYGISGGMTLWDGFYNYNSMRQNLFNYRANKMDYEQAKLDLILNVMTLYYQVLGTEEILNETKLQLDLSQKQVDRLTVLNDNNAISPNIYYDAKGQLANDKINLITVKNNLETIKLNLLQVLNIDNVTKIKLEKSEPTINNTATSPEMIYQNSILKFPSLIASENRKQSYKRNMKASYGTLFPTLSLVGSIGTNYSNAASTQRYNYISDVSSDNYVIINNSKVPVYSPQYSFSEEKIDFKNQFKNNLNSYIGVNLQVPIFNSLKQKTQIDISKINFVQYDLQNKSNLIKIKLNVHQAYLNMTSSQEKYQVTQEQSLNYTESFKIAITKFEKGAITSVDYAFAKVNHDRAKLNLITAKYDFFLKQKMLEYYQGDLSY